MYYLATLLDEQDNEFKVLFKESNYYMATKRIEEAIKTQFNIKKWRIYTVVYISDKIMEVDNGGFAWL